MQKLIKSLLKDKSIYLAIIITIVIAILSLIRIGKQPVVISFKYLDKLEHAIAYLTLAFLWLFTFKNNKKVRYVVLILCVLFGVLMEFLQSSLTNYRTFDYADMIANALGVLIAFFLFILIKKNEAIC